jgi:ribosomal protein S18 acetylase RimI-like enzyme
MIIRKIYIHSKINISMVIIREATEYDLEKMIDIGILCFQDDFQDGLSKDNTYNNAKVWFKERYSNKTFARYHVAEENGDVVGYIFHLMIGGISGVVQLEQIGVHPQQRQKGIGKKLINISEQFWKKYMPEKFGKPLYKMLLTTSVINDKAHNLYAKCGFEHDCTMKKIYWGNDEEIWLKEFK